LKGQRVNRLHYRAIFLILSHRHCIERVSLRIQLFDALALVHPIGLVTGDGHRFAFLDTF
jgi:hypothetical protein